MFKVRHLDGTGPDITVYSVGIANSPTGDHDGAIVFLVWDDGEWKWLYADAYGPGYN